MVPLGSSSLVRPLPSAPRSDPKPGRGGEGDDRRGRLDGEQLPLLPGNPRRPLREALGDPILADRITLDHRRAGLDERRTAILDFAVKITERPLDCDPEDLERDGSSSITQGTSRRVLVHAVVKHEEELAEFRRQGIELIALESVLEALCPPTRPAFTASAGTDIADLIEYYGRVRQLPVDDEIEEGEDE